MDTLFLCEFFRFCRIAIPPLPCIGTQKRPKPPFENKKVSTRIIRVDTFDSSKLFT